MSLVETNIPPKPRTLSVQVEHTAEGLLLSRRNLQKATGAFLLIWLTGWTVGCVFLIGLAWAEPKPFTFMFAVPFWASWFLVFFILLKSFFQRDRVVISREGLRFERHVIVRLQERFVPLDEIQQFEIFSEVTDSESGTREWGIEMETVGTPMRFFPGLDEQEREWLRHLLNDMLSQLGGGAVNVRSGAEEVESSEETATVASRGAHVLSAAAQAARPPTDCRWQRIEGYGPITFLQRGKLSWTALFGLLFINAFWNGIVSVFVIGLFNGEMEKPGGFGWWGLFLFLIPFEVIGLCMVVGLLFALIEPFRRTTWEIGEHKITRKHKWFGLGPTKQVDYFRLDRIELHERSDSEKRSSSPRQLTIQSNSPNNSPFELVFVDDANNTFCTIENLTEGEARWMADIVLRERPFWFR